MCVSFYSVEGACNCGQCIINTLSCRCTIIFVKSLGLAIRNITIPTTHQMYTCTMKENTSFLSFHRYKLKGWKTLGPQWGLSTCRKNVGLLSYVQLIKLWCAPSPCSCMRFHLFPQPCSALPSRSITLKHVFVLSRLDDCIFVNFFSSKGQCSSQHVASCLSRRGSGRQRNSINIIALMVFTWV